MCITDWECPNHVRMYLCVSAVVWLSLSCFCEYLSEHNVDPPYTLSPGEGSQETSPGCVKAAFYMWSVCLNLQACWRTPIAASGRLIMLVAEQWAVIAVVPGLEEGTLQQAQ